MNILYFSLFFMEKNAEIGYEFRDGVHILYWLHLSGNIHDSLIKFQEAIMRKGNCKVHLVVMGK